MIVSELITPAHLNRQALIYVRQSSPHQTLTNQESLHLQYDLQQRARDCGWDLHAIEVIDCDLGLTGSTTQGRPGFQAVVTKVTLGQVGILFSYDVTRLSRNCSDWYQLLDLCGYRQCLIGDRDGIYDPASTNGRLLLGLKGQISELELHTLRARLTAGLLNKARRGDLALRLPAGMVRDELGQVRKHPHREVQERITLIFTTFLQLKTVGRLVRFFNERRLTVPRTDHWGDIVWRPATVFSLISTLKNPAYAGAFVYGRTQATPQPGSPQKRLQKPLPVEQWRVRIPDRYPAYVDWDTYLKIRAMLQDNRNAYDRQQSRGVPRGGKALLHGIVYCGECGHKMMVGYRAGGRYICEHLRRSHPVPVCQYLPAAPVDAFVVQALFDALAPAELDVYARAVVAFQQEANAVRQARLQQLERLRYQACLAERQFNQSDPDNRLVTAELEKRWEIALQDLKQAEESLAQDPQSNSLAALDPEIRKALEQGGRKLPELWHSDLLTQQQRKAFVRCLIDKVVLHRTAPDRVRTRIVWKGGDTTQVDLPVPVGSLTRLSGVEEMKQTIVRLAKQGKTDEEIAQRLTQHGHRSPLGSVVLPSTVKTIRLREGVFFQPSRSHPRRVPGYLTVSQIARKLQVSRHWLYDCINKGKIRGVKHRKWQLFLFPDTAKTINLIRQLRQGTINKLRF